jgi:diguanylate cyclase
MASNDRLLLSRSSKKVSSMHLSPRMVNSAHGWSSVARWTIFGTLACILVAIVFNAVMFHDLAPEALQRALISSTVLPILMAVPLFLYLGIRLRGLAITNRRLGLVARTDGLTACLNRGAFTAKVETQLSEGRDSGALLMIDADNFKVINDLFGHDNGDEALMIIARAIRGVLRAGDLVGRMGGEEFAVFMPGVDKSGAEAMAEAIRRSVNHSKFAPDGRNHRLAVSIGGAVFDQPSSFAELFRIADQRLYGAKRAGRNCANIQYTTDEPAIDLRKRA